MTDTIQDRLRGEGSQETTEELVEALYHSGQPLHLEAADYIDQLEADIARERAYTSMPQRNDWLEEAAKVCDGSIIEISSEFARGMKCACALNVESIRELKDEDDG